MTELKSVSSGRGRARLVWVVTLLAVIAFGGAGIVKLAGDQSLAEQFTRFGLAPWFMTLVGAGEVIGALALLVRPIATLGGLGLAGIAFGAIIAHLVNDPIQRGIPALALLALALLVAYLRTGDFAATASRLSPRA